MDELLRHKLVGSGIERYMIVSAYLDEGADPGGAPRTKKLIKEFEIS